MIIKQTPEQSARMLVKHWAGQKQAGDRVNTETKIAEIADLIQSAVEAERETCAQIAKEMKKLIANDEPFPKCCFETAEEILSAIRARGGENK